MARASPRVTRTKPPVSAFGSVDPAPAAAEKRVPALRAVLLNAATPMFERFQAVFALRALQSDEAALALGDAMLADESVLLRHECAYVLGQMQREASIPQLVHAARTDANPMVRHEACEALGAIGTDAVIPVLEDVGVRDPAIEVRESCEVALAHIAWLSDPKRF